MNDKRLHELCFGLAEQLMWEKDTTPLNKLPEQLAELSEMTEKFVHICRDNYYLVEGLENSENILFGSILYLKAQGIPPLRGNYHWFNYSLGTLLELCNPQSGIERDGLPFLQSLKSGVNLCLKWAEEDNGEHFS